MDLHQLRRQYQSGELRRKDLAADPIVQFEYWLKELLSLNTPDPTAMVLATVGQQQRPSQRVVLLKHVDRMGFVFFTNRESRKGRDIAGNKRVNLHFPWYFINRQVEVSGTVEWTSKEEDEAYFCSRPQQSQWAAWASSQSQPLASRQQLLGQFTAKKAEYPDNIPLPEYWGGYRVVPETIEFWQGRENRLHDRFLYNRIDNEKWGIQRLSP